MKFLFFAILLAIPPASLHSSAPIAAVQFTFASIEQGRQVLTNRDDFIKRLSHFDRSARLKTSEPVPEPAFLAFIATNVLSFTPQETNLLGNALLNLKPRLEHFNLSWPSSILIVKTTGREEANAAYTRAHAIVIPSSDLAPASSKSLEKTLCHELFHILSRHNPQLKLALYNSIGFHKCAELTLPEPLVRITNPDAPINDHWIQIANNGQALTAIPVLLAAPPAYDPKKGGEFFSYLSFKLLIVELNSAGVPSASFADSRPILLDLKDTHGYFDQVGQNTNYIIHPEEILAENFVLLVNKAKSVKSPEVLTKIKKVLLSSQPDQP